MAEEVGEAEPGPAGALSRAGRQVHGSLAAWTQLVAVGGAAVSIGLVPGLGTRSWLQPHTCSRSRGRGLSGGPGPSDTLSWGQNIH